MKKIIVLSALMLAASSFGSVNAQSLLDLLNGGGSSKTEPAATEKINKDAFVGVWQYSGAAVEFTGTDLVAVLGSSMAAPAIKQSLETYYAKAGLVPGSCTIEFTETDRYMAKTAKERVEGLYVFDHPGQKVKIHYQHKELGGEGSMDARLKFTGDKLQVMFEADKIVAIIKELTKDQALDQNVKDLIDLISEYKGLYLGFEMEK